MKNIFPSLLALSFFLSYSIPYLQAETEKPVILEKLAIPVEKTPAIVEKPVTFVKPEPRPLTPVVAAKFEPFTGKIIKNKVRLRLQPTYDGPILREFNRNDFVVVLGETEDFYAIQPPADFYAYVFRTYVLDNVIEGNRVNVRLKPDLEAPVVAQLKSGDRVQGAVASNNSKWLEIKLPETTRFYIAKEFIEKAGDVNLKARLEKKHDEVYHLLYTTEAVSKAELAKPFTQMSIEGIKANFQHIILDYPEFPEAATQAKEALAAVQETYTAKKLAYLEEQSRRSSSAVDANKKLQAELQAHKSKINHLEQQIEQTRQAPPIIAVAPPQQPPPTQLPINMSMWLPIEENLFNTWSKQTGQQNPQDFYNAQKQQAFVLKGIVDPYNRPVKNKPGDYMLLNSLSKLPMAFLYSTHVNLQAYVGHEVSLVVIPRHNNNFAFPAYFVLALE